MYESQTYETILGRMLGRVPGRFDRREGSVIWDSLSPTAIELQILYIELDALINEAYGDTASRNFLILRCHERGIYPYGATNAILKGEFSPANIDVAGQRFNISNLNYAVTEKISDGVYQVQCETAGIAGNQYLGTMIPIDYIEGLETAELTEVLIPGEDEEATEALRARYFASFDEKAFGGNAADYIEKTNAIPGVGSVKVTRIWNNGIEPASMIPNGTVASWYEGIISTLTGDVKTWLETVYNAAKNKWLATGGTVLLTILDSEYGIPSQTLVDTVQETIDPDNSAGNGLGIAPIGHIVTVKKADAVDITVNTSITFNSGYNWNNMQSSINSAIEAYLLELRKAWADEEYLIVRVSQIETRLLALDGILDISNTRINTVAGNLTLGKYEVPTFKGAGA